MKRIAIDMDEVIADFNPKMLQIFNQTFDLDVTIESLYGTNLLRLYPELNEEIHNIISDPLFFSDLDVIKNSQSAIETLSKHYEIFITTAAMEYPNSFNAKFYWLQKHFPFIDPLNYVFCGSKRVINADYLIDDNARHFIGFTGQGILFSAPHNMKIGNEYTRVNDWNEVKTLFLQ